MVRRRTPHAVTLTEAIHAATNRGPGARSHAEIEPPSGRHLVIATESGVVASIDRDALIADAAGYDVVIAEERAVGEFAVAGTPLLSWWSANELIPTVQDEQALDAACLRAIAIGGAANDVRSRLRGAGLDELAAGLCLLARLPDPPRAHMDGAGFWRLLAAEQDFAATLGEATQRWLGPEHAERMLLLLREVAFASTLPARRSAVAYQRDRLLRILAEENPGPDREARLARLSEAVDDALEGRWTRWSPYA